jgi:hypothetical protein
MLCQQSFLHPCSAKRASTHLQAICPKDMLQHGIRCAAGLRALSPALDGSLAARIQEFNAQDIVFTANACIGLRGSYEALPQAIATEVEARGFSDFNLGEAAYIARALATHKALTSQLQAALQHLMHSDVRIQRWQVVHIRSSLKMAQGQKMAKRRKRRSRE